MSCLICKRGVDEQQVSDLICSFGPGSEVNFEVLRCDQELADELKSGCLFSRQRTVKVFPDKNAKVGMKLSVDPLEHIDAVVLSDHIEEERLWLMKDINQG